MSSKRLEEYFAADELPIIIGAPAVPHHPIGRRIAYALTGISAGAVATLGNGLVAANINAIPGGLGLYTSEASLLTAVYFGMSAGANLALVKARAEFGIPAIVRTMLLAYAVAAVIQIVWPGFTSEVLVRAVSGVAAAGLITLGIQYLVQDFPKASRPVGVVTGLSLTQLGVPLARLFPLEMISQNAWLRLDLVELAIPLSLLALTMAFPLPPSRCEHVFERLDFLIIGLLIPAFILLSMVFSEGRLLWWTDTPWLGIALAATSMLVGTAVIVERLRSRPLIHFEWITSRDLVRFAAIALFVRFALAEQTFGAIGFLTAGGLTNDQLHGLFLFVIAGVLLGIATSAIAMLRGNIRYLVIAAALVIAIAALIDSNSNPLTRPPQLYLSQFLIGYGTTLFIGPSFLSGFVHLLRKGDEYFVSFVVVFSMTQNIGGIAGSAILGSLQVLFTNLHAQALWTHLSASDPNVGHRIGAGVAALSSRIVDPTLQTKEGAALLAQALQGQAQSAAFLDIFHFTFVFALGVACYASYVAFMSNRGAHTMPLEMT
jgi:hypothetical protein